MRPKGTLPAGLEATVAKEDVGVEAVVEAVVV